MTDRDIVYEYNQRYDQGNQKIQEFRDKAKTDVEFYLGKQFTDSELSYLSRNDREAITNNKIRRAVELVSGWQRSNRMSSIMLPLGNENQQTSDQLSKSIQYVYSKRFGYNHLSDCFQYGSLISGINFSEIILDYTEDIESPDIKFIRIPYNAAIWDPYFTKLDMSDCEYFIRRKYVSKSEAVSLLPESAKDIKSMKDSRYSDNKFPEMPYASNPNDQEMLAYDEYWQRVVEKRHVLVNVQSDKIIASIDNNNKEKSESMIKMFPFLKTMSVEMPTVKLAVIINGELMKYSSDPLGIDEYPFTPIIGYFVPEYDDYSMNIQSFIRIANDPQRELNKRISKALDIIDKKIHVGHYYKPGKLIDHEDILSAGNFKNIALKDEAIIGQDISPIPSPQTDQSIFQMSQIMDNNIMEVLGLNDATFGVPQSGNESGLLTMIRQSASMYSIQPLFDNLNVAQYLHTRKVAKTIQKWWKPEKVKRILNEDPTPQFYDPSFVKFDVQVAQGIETETQQKMFFAQLVQLNQMGANIPWSILLKYAPLQEKGTLLEEMKVLEQQQAQQAQQQQELMQQQIALQNEKTVSEIEENRSNTIRGNARAIADIGLTSAHIAEATQKRANAALDLVKASKEIENMDNRQLLDSMLFINSIIDKKAEENANQLLFEKSIVDSYRTPQEQALGGV